MANKTQAKAAVDNAVVSIKDEIDNRLPTGVNIKDGSLSFGPTRISIIMDAGGVLATATSWRDTIQTNLTAAGRAYKTRSSLGRRENDATNEKEIVILTNLCVYIITNIG